VCWGDNSRGELGIGSTKDHSSPGKDIPAPTAIGDWGQVSANTNYTCATYGVGQTGGYVYCWGANTDGSIGDGTYKERHRPAEIALGYRNWMSVSAGTLHACATQFDHSAWCWGDNGSGQLGDGTKTASNKPVKVTGGHMWASISAGNSYTCGITTSGTLWCWGYNFYGQLGIGTKSLAVTTPTQVGTASDWVQVSTGTWHACARNSGGSVYCWGSNTWGNLGTGNNTQQSAPTKIATVFGVTSYTSVSAGDEYTCALGTTGTDASAWCWGRNNHGQLGIGSVTDSNRPREISNIEPWTWRTIAAGAGSHTCALKSDDVLWCWGHNDQGQLGIGTAGPKDSPAPVAVP
jgi:alpha-tubulin suppressor-like RCC1 family protein